MTIRWVKGSAYLTIDGTVKVDCWCDVRTIANGRRKRHEVVYTIPGKQPYDPVTFPKGKWKVGRPKKRETPYLRPWFIPTDAWIELDIWDVDKSGYLGPSGLKVIDRDYGLHFSTSPTTLGCIRIAKEQDLLTLVKMIQECKEEVFLEVL